MTHVVILGAYGSAGVAVADRLAGADGVELTLIDDGEPGGGLCILRGCMPSKEVLSAAAHRYLARHDHRLDGEAPSVDLEAVYETKEDHIQDFAAHRRAAVHGLTEENGVEFIHDTGWFVGDRTIAVGDRTIDADYVVIATGSIPNIPDLPGIDDIDPWTSADVLDATEFPDSGVVMGFGYIGLELVPYLAEAAGMDLTVIEHDERPLDEADPEFGDELLDLYRTEFDIEILTETYEERIESTDAGIRLHTDRTDAHETVDADTVFAFTGRRPNIDGLGVGETALEPDDEWVEATMQARDDPRTFVVGDVNGREPILHVAKEQGFRAAANILAHRAGAPLTPYEPVHHHVVFSGLGVYPYFRVGHSETSARAADLDIVTATRRAEDDGVFKTKNAARGLARMVVDAADGTVLGIQGLHYHADTAAKAAQIIVEGGLDVRELPDRAYHPTLPEILDGLIRETRDQL